MKIKTREMLALAFGIALLPPLWAVCSPHIGVTTGGVALICAAVYVANGNCAKDGIKISVGFLLGDLWAVIALWSVGVLPVPDDFALFITLFVLGALAVIIASLLAKIIYLPAWLCGWAVGLTVMGEGGFSGIGTLPVQIAVSMLVGVWYVGFGVDLFSRLFLPHKKK